jgi:hypothetical protein
MNPKQYFEIHQARRNIKFSKLDIPTISLPRAYCSEEGERISFKMKWNHLHILCNGILDQRYHIYDLDDSTQETIDSLARSKSSLGEVNSELSGIIEG